jgi:Flp pilus assembly pilin Flp
VSLAGVRGGMQAMKLKPTIERLRALLRDESGQTAAEYSVLMWFFTLVGAACLTTFIFAFEESIVAYYEDIVNIVCLPIP